MNSDAGWQDNGKLKLMIIAGTRPEIIRLSEVIRKCRIYFDTVLCHTGQNYDYSLNGVFFKDLELDAPQVYLDAAGGARLGISSAVLMTGCRSLSRTPCLYWAIRIPACLQSARSGCISLFFTWKPGTGARMSACRKKQTGGLWILFRM